MTTTAEGKSSHSEGDGTQAKDDYSHVEGYGTFATAMAKYV